MKRFWGKFVISGAVLLCLFLVFGRSSISSQAKVIVNPEKGMLYSGRRFNTIIKEHANQVVIGTSEDTIIDSIIFTNNKKRIEKLPTKVAVGNDVYAYFTEDRNVIYVYSPDKIKFNPDCDFMFASFRTLDNISFDDEVVDTSQVTTMECMFYRAGQIGWLYLDDFDTSNVEDMRSMFSGCYRLNHLDLSAFDTSKVKDMNRMFLNCTSLSGVNLSGLTIREDTDVTSMLNTGSDFACVISPKKTAKFIDMYTEMAIDNNDDEYADSDQIYTAIPPSDKSNIYRNARLLKKKPAEPDSPKEDTKTNTKNADKTADKTASSGNTFSDSGITYQIIGDKKVMVTSITAKGSVKLGKVTHNGAEYSVCAIADNACKGNTRIKKLTITSKLESVGKNAFKGCKKLSKITISCNKKLNVGKGAFKKLKKGATIKVNGVKGSAKKKVISRIKKQTNASVK
ncbi:MULTISPECIES: BspA family leucine-rich repeat surface protein [unclassified Butyrivibrio]|uniref:BspA family leucine-rich repeat surface protein n=1 Tax=unclassified Butyrivibrio TaxID=2639466 RepID=UPI0003FCC662|nr:MULTISPECIES: BspA family leucine-rich repeat surface protein [unclassified Butyrivibrio]